MEMSDNRATLIFDETFSAKVTSIPFWMNQLLVGEPAGTAMEVDFHAEDDIQSFREIINDRDHVFNEGFVCLRISTSEPPREFHCFHLPGAAKSMVRIDRNTEKENRIIIKRVRPADAIRSMDDGAVELNELLNDPYCIRGFRSYKSRLEKLKAHRKEC